MAAKYDDRHGGSFRPGLYRPLQHTAAAPAKTPELSPPPDIEPEPAPQNLIARDFDGFRALLNNRRMELCISMLELDHIASLPSGYSAKLLSAPRKKGGSYNRNIGPESMGKPLDALVVGIRLVPDVPSIGGLQEVPCEGDLPRGINICPQLALLRERGRKGGKAAYAKMSACKRTTWHRKGQKASAAARRRKSKARPVPRIAAE